jgi:hypothetical protein
MIGIPKNGSGQNRLRVLLIEDSPADAEIEIAELRRAGFDVAADVVDTREQAREHLEKIPTTSSSRITICRIFVAWMRSIFSAKTALTPR